MQGGFNELVTGTRHETSGDIAIFNLDRTGNTHHKRLFIHLTNTRNVLTFVNTTAIAYRQNSAFLR